MKKARWEWIRRLLRLFPSVSRFQSIPSAQYFRAFPGFKLRESQIRKILAIVEVPSQFRAETVPSFKRVNTWLWIRWYFVSKSITRRRAAAEEASGSVPVPILQALLVKNGKIEQGPGPENFGKREDRSLASVVASDETDEISIYRVLDGPRTMFDQLKRDLETPSEVLLKRRLGLYKRHGKRSSETRDRSRGLSYDQRTQYRELIVQLRKGNNITMASSDKEQAVWPEHAAADSLEIQIANIFLDMSRTLSAHRGL
ncbi:hypothetical protein L596_021413 [Steinernema carpocapsae]|uniref:Uncharacterized protein n=1 Tax=Steinernema carpocapsae TaxID=34508 RepID=A0A4U5MIM6_STECR|nr:hypothetical protein L596_021413 [Steinernema carpocapsae]